ncbi:MAG: type I secretion system permease/ATPase [Pseudomonadota bacterium]
MTVAGRSGEGTPPDRRATPQGAGSADARNAGEGRAGDAKDQRSDAAQASSGGWETPPAPPPGTRTDGTTTPVGAAPESSGAGARAPEPPALGVARWFAAHHARPYSAAALLARLPAGAEGTAPPLMARALAALGLRSRLVLRRVARLDPAVLPALLFTRDGRLLVLTGLSDDRRRGRIVAPEVDALEQEVPLGQLAREVRREILLVTVEDDLAERRLDAAAPERRRHWFWGPMRQNSGALAQVLLASFGVNLLGLALPIFVMNVYDRVIPTLAFVTLWTLAAGVAIAVVLDLVLRSVRASVLERVGRRLDTGIAATLFAHAMRLPLLARPGGASGIVNHIRDFDAVREFFSSASFVAAIDVLFIGVFLFVLWLIVGPLALVPLIAVPVVLLLSLVAQGATGRAVGRAQVLAGRRHAVLVETLMNPETVKALGAEPVLQREWDRATAASARLNGRARFWANFAVSGTQMALQGTSVGIIVWGVYLVAVGQITIGALIAANILAGRALAPLATVSQTVFRAQYALRAMAALSRFMREPPETGTVVGSALRVERAEIALRGVSVRYSGAETDALSGIDLDVAPGDAVAILGRVGSGKSTLGRVMAGLVPHGSGQVLIDGRGLNQYDPAELRAGIGYLPQEAELFTGTLRENLLIGRPRAPEAEIARALHLSAMARFVTEAPEGLDLFVGERGARLSGGQRQGVALARLLLRRPKLLFLDEPTSAMDRDTEAEIALHLQTLVAEGTGLILCTHRPSLAGIAARWVVLDKGRKALDGSRDRVMAQLQGGPDRSAAE